MHVNGTIQIGDNTFIGANSKLFIRSNIFIGSDCTISWNVQIADSDIHQMIIGGQERPSSAPIIIGNKVWIGANSSILKGVPLGDGTVVAAGSVVTQSFPLNSLVGGVPAKILKGNIDWKV